VKYQKTQLICSKPAIYHHHKLQTALDQAKGIFLSHYHGDHAGGVIISPNFYDLAKKTIILAETARLLVEEPHRPHLAITEDDVAWNMDNINLIKGKAAPWII
jgi:glyoxylase-like metal-dependent hydrolase (beta-lactamase superfamily II)